MRKCLLLAALSLTPALSSCGEPPLLCALALDGSDFGFTLQAPDRLTCTSSFGLTNDILKGFVSYSDSLSDAQVAVIVGSSSSVQDSVPTDVDPDAVCEDLGTVTNANGVEFERCKFEDDNGKFIYSATTELPTDGLFLLITIISDTENDDLVDLLDLMIETTMVM